MSKKKTAAFLTTAMLAGVMALPMLRAADDTKPADTTPPRQNDGGGGRRFDPAQFREQMMTRLKEQLGATDDEFAAIQPKLEKVMQLSADANGRGGMMGFGGRGARGRNRNRGDNGGGAGGDQGQAQQPQSAVAKASADLRTVLDDKDAKPEDIKAKLDALRDARTKAKEDLTKAQDDLKSLLSQRQEAVLVMMGMLQ